MVTIRKISSHCNNDASVIRHCEIVFVLIQSIIKQKFGEQVSSLSPLRKILQTCHCLSAASSKYPRHLTTPTSTPIQNFFWTLHHLQERGTRRTKHGPRRLSSTKLLTPQSFFQRIDERRTLFVNTKFQRINVKTIIKLITIITKTTLHCFCCCAGLLRMQIQRSTTHNDIKQIAQNSEHNSAILSR